MIGYAGKPTRLPFEERQFAQPPPATATGVLPAVYDTLPAAA